MQRCVVAAMDRILPRSLAAGRRCFRRAFCAAADSGGQQQPPPLPDAALLPHSVRGIISNYFDHYRPEWFVRPRGNGSPSISMPYADWRCDDAVRDHCNGLILYERDDGEQSLWVLNPATRRLAVLPPLEDAIWHRAAGAAFDPSVSLHYGAFLIPEVPEPEGCRRRDGDEAAERLHDDATLDGSAEWPPAVHRLQVYSSRSGVWEERAFVREGSGPIGTVAEACSDSLEPVYFGPVRRYAVCWRDALYVHCRGAYVMRYVHIDMPCI